MFGVERHVGGHDVAAPEPEPVVLEKAQRKGTGAENDRKAPPAAPCNVVALPVVSPSCARKAGLRNRKSEVRILPGALEIPGTSPTPRDGGESDKGPAKRHNASEAAENGLAGVVALPPGAVTLADIRKALDAALLEGDLHRARRLNALAAEIEDLGVGGHRGNEEEARRRAAARVDALESKALAFVRPTVRDFVERLHHDVELDALAGLSQLRRLLGQDLHSRPERRARALLVVDAVAHAVRFPSARQDQWLGDVVASLLIRLSKDERRSLVVRAVRNDCG